MVTLVGLALLALSVYVYVHSRGVLGRLERLELGHGMAVGGKVYAADMRRIHAGEDPAAVRADREARLRERGGGDG